MAFQQGPQTIYTVGAGNLAANLLVKTDGTGLVIANTATPADLPVGVTYTAGLIGAVVPVCGIEYGILSIMATAAAININDIVYAAAGGMIANTAGGRAIGVARSATAGSTVVEVVPMPLILTAAALAASVAVTLTLSAGSSFTLGSMTSGTIYLTDSTFTGGFPASSVLDENFQTLGKRYQAVLADVNDLRTKLKTTLIVQ